MLIARPRQTRRGRATRADGGPRPTVGRSEALGARWPPGAPVRHTGQLGAPCHPMVDTVVRDPPGPAADFADRPQKSYLTKLHHARDP